MMMRRKLIEVTETIVTAVLYWLFAYYVIYGTLADGRPLVAYALNLAFIILILLMDKFADHIMNKDDFLLKDRGKVKNFLCTMLFYVHAVSFKTGVYLFYLVMLVVSRISILEPGIISPYLRTFIYSVEYGILLLLPLDKFFELLSKDDRRLLSILDRINPKK